MEDLRLTHIGGPTLLIEAGGWRLLTDPTFDPPGGSYRFGWGTGSRKLAGPAIDASEIGPIDAVLLSHDHHDDNLDAPVTGPVRYTMTGRDAVEMCRLLRPRVAIPIHYEGWKHFRQGREAVERELADASEDVRDAIRWLPIGVAVET